MPQFNPPPLEKRKSPGQAFAEPILDTAQKLPATILAYQQYKMQKMQNDLQMKHLMAQIEKENAPTSLVDSAGNVVGEVSGKAQVLPAPTNIVSPTGDVVGTVGGKAVVLPSPKESQEDKDKSKLKAKLEAEKPQAFGAMNETIRAYDNMINEAKAIKNDPGLGSSTGLLKFWGSVPKTKAKRVAARVETLKAKTLLIVLESLKQLSRTGASGFGALSEKEGETIKSSVSTLDRGLDKQDFSDSLDRFISEMEAKKKNLVDTFSDVYGEFPVVDISTQKVPSARVRVRNKMTGQTGTISEQNFNPDKYERLP